MTNAEMLSKNIRLMKECVPTSCFYCRIITNREEGNELCVDDDCDVAWENWLKQEAEK